MRMEYIRDTYGFRIARFPSPGRSASVPPMTPMPLPLVRDVAHDGIPLPAGRHLVEVSGHGGGILARIRLGAHAGAGRPRVEAVHARAGALDTFNLAAFAIASVTLLLIVALRRQLPTASSTAAMSA